MATGRTRKQDLRVFIDQYGAFNNSWFNVGPLVCEFDAPMGFAFSDAVKSAKGGLAEARTTPGSLQGYLSTNPAGDAFDDLHDVLQTPGVQRILTVQMGIRAAPVAGDPCFIGAFHQKEYVTEDLPGSGITAVRLPFESNYGQDQDTVNPFGKILDPGTTARTAANAGGGIDFGAASANGGFAVIHLLASDGTCEFTVEHSTDDEAYSTLLTFALTGSAVGAELKSVAGAINRYVRWQITLDAATSVTFALALARAN